MSLKVTLHMNGKEKCFVRFVKCLFFGNYKGCGSLHNAHVDGSLFEYSVLDKEVETVPEGRTEDAIGMELFSAILSIVLHLCYVLNISQPKK